MALILSEAEGDKQEGELTAARRLLDEAPALDGATITGDALFTHADIARTIVQDKGADYILAVKGSQPKLHAHATHIFNARHPGAARPLFGKAQ